MNLLIDTHAVIWFITDDDYLSIKVKELTEEGFVPRVCLRYKTWGFVPRWFVPKALLWSTTDVMCPLNGSITPLELWKKFVYDI